MSDQLPSLKGKTLPAIATAESAERAYATPETFARVGRILRVTDAILAANKWTVLAAPILRECINLDEMQKTLSSIRFQHVEENRKAGRYPYGGNAQCFDEALKPITKAHTELLDILDGIRDNALCDVFFETRDDAPDEETDRTEVENNDVRQKVTSVDAAIAAMIETMNKEGPAR